MSGMFDALAEQQAPVVAGSGRPRLREAERRQVALRASSLDDLLAQAGVAVRGGAGPRPAA